MKFVFVLAAVMLAAVPGFAADAERGRALYEARCDACHNAGVHQRRSRIALSFVALRTQVARWNAELGGAWGAEEVDDVTVYLNNLYYFHRCPESVCRSVQAVLSPAPLVKR